MNAYYYLNDARQPQGPHTLDELQAMLKTGKLAADTLAAPRGGDSWVALSTLLNTTTAAQHTPQQVGNCPACRAELSTEMGELPQRCPGCGYRLRPANPASLWQHFVQALCKTFVLKGRATRMEFWCFFLFCTIICLLYQMIMEFLMVGAMAILGSEEMVDIIIIIALALVGMLIGLLLTIPQITVTVRRLHDVGKSGKWLLAAVLLYAIATCGVAGFAYKTYSDVVSTPPDARPITVEQVVTGTEATTASELLTPEEEEEYDIINDKVFDAIRHNIPLLIGGVVLPYLLCLFISLYILIICFLDSNHGPNRYGPSTKYPTAS